MSWEQLVQIYQDGMDPDFRGDDIERTFCPNDGTILKMGMDGNWYCPFDSYRPLSGLDSP